ncbi:hypothetical protein THALO_290138 [Tenacibaculum halocynthiae]|nr:hypothetical protein SAMN04487765_3276 [Tenacibaculum sp. MAR_2010_89]
MKNQVILLVLSFYKKIKNKSTKKHPNLGCFSLLYKNVVIVYLAYYLKKQ